MRSRHGKPRSRHGDPPAQDRWLLSYADFVTLLLAVFIVLFASSFRERGSLKTVSTAIHSGFEAMSVTPPPRPEQPQVPSVRPAGREPEGIKAMPPEIGMSELSRQLHNVLGDAISKREIVMQQTQDGLVISLRELGSFNSGEASLLPGAAETLRGTAQVLKQHGLELRVEGHSDDQPIHTAMFHSNWELSAARATSVLTLLLEGTGFPPDKISVAGYGPYHPVADNATSEGRRMNRRVDLVVVAPRGKEEILR